MSRLFDDIQRLKFYMVGPADDFAESRRRFDGAFYSTGRWRRLRYRVFLEQGNVCACCGATKCELHVDHIKPRSKYPQLQWDINNLQVLCRDCNFAKGAWNERDWRDRPFRVMKDEG